MAKVLTIPVVPNPKAKKARERSSDPRYLDGQRCLVNAMSYLVKSGPRRNKAAISLLSEHVRTNFRMEDRPLHPTGG
jgi:hypothetical protein